jgi:two-component system sensor histidine kinase BaeS
MFLGRRLRLLDENRLHVIGPHYGGNDEVFRPIVLDNVIVGWLAVRPVTAFTDRLVLSFLEQQKRANTLIFALALGLSMLVSLILARVFLAPIRRLANGVQALAEGRYDTQITPSSRDELGQLARHFNLLAQTLQSNEKARRQWIADIAHELRTPLAILKGEIEAMQDGIRQPTPDSLRSLHGEVSALTKLVGDLHELSVSDMGAMNYRRVQTDLAEVLREVCEQFAQRFANGGLELVNRIAADAIYPVFADPSRLSQLFSNLLENSCRYTDSPGLCEITVDNADQTVAVNFRDTGPGVADEDLPKLFDRLYRVDKSRSRDLGGSGLGLSIAKNIVEAHGGTITAQQCEYGGLWIRVSLPSI